MVDNYDKHITKSIISLYKRRLFSPCIYLILLIFFWFALGISSILFPKAVSSDASLEELYQENLRYIKGDFSNLYFTGYTQDNFGFTSGYYYYTMRGDDCIVILLSPSTCEEGLPEIESTTITGKIVLGSPSYRSLLENLCNDLNWTKTGIQNKVSAYYLSEPDFKPVASHLLTFFIYASGIYSLLSIIAFLLYIRFPFLAPPCRQLSHFGKTKALLAMAEEELATLPQLATEDMFITEHFFIETSNYGIAIVPISEIIWIYKHSTLHKFFWYHFSISYTLHITANNHVYIQCPKNIKSDIDGIMDYLAEANHNILIGFNEENRIKVQDIQGTPLQFEKFISFLKKKI